MTDVTALFEMVTWIRKRCSCREYLPEPVNEELLELMLDMARIAPSACNRQPWQFVVANTPELCAEVAACYDREWVKTVPAFIIACGLHDEAWHRPADGKDHTDIDVAIAVEHICLCAATLEMGTCWICNFDVPKLRQAFNIPDNVEPIAIIAIGTPAKQLNDNKVRKSLDEVVKWGKY